MKEEKFCQRHTVTCFILLKRCKNEMSKKRSLRDEETNYCYHTVNNL